MSCLVLLACSMPPLDPPESSGPSKAQEGFPSVRIGMHYNSVINLMGTPTDENVFTSSYGTSKSCYWYRMDSDTYDWDYYYAIDFEGDYVTYIYSG